VASLVIVGLALVWAAPWLARQVIRTGRGGTARPAEAGPARVDAFLAAGLPQAGAARLLEQAEREQVLHATWQLGPGRTAEEAARSLRDQARDAGIELHELPRDLLDAEVRVYAGSQLRQDLLLIPALPADTPPPRGANRRERPLVALVVAGLGPTDDRALVRRDVPLTVAIRPFTPFALSTARDAALAWQEVLVDLDAHEDDLSAARASLPFSSGALLAGRDPAPVAPLFPREILVQTAQRPPDLDPAVTTVEVWQARDRGTADVLARLRYLAARDGHTALLLQRSDPALDGVLDWAEGADAAGYRLVLASEVARPVDMIGLRARDNPRAHPQ